MGQRREKVIAVTGDLAKPCLGVSAAKRRQLEGKITHLFHLGAIYDLKADAESQETTNIKGT